MTTVLSPHWKVLVTLLKMLIFAPDLIADSALSVSASGQFRKRCHSSETARGVQWNDTASICMTHQQSKKRLS
ncbi:MAG: hypothetical protein KBF33_12205, partial [Comamonas sp.]|nr:hypothetical protein [Comamonas sp.]